MSRGNRRRSGPPARLVGDLELVLGRGRIDVAGGIDRPDLELVLAGLRLELLRRGAGLPGLLVDLALEGRAGLVGGELVLGPLPRALVLRLLGDRRLGWVGVLGAGEEGVEDDVDHV